MPEIGPIHELLQLIEDHGLSVVLLVITILGWITITQWFQKREDNMLTLLTKNIFKPESVESVVALTSEIKATLAELEIEMDCDWCQLWQFHNGTHGLGKNRIPFMYLTMTHEVCRNESQPMRQDATHLPITFFDEVLTELLSVDVIVHQNRNETPKEPMTKLLDTFGARVGMIRLIRDEDNLIVGFMLAAWKNSNTIIDKRRLQFLNGTMRMTALLASYPDNQLLK